jgi:hypothetical protein
MYESTARGTQPSRLPPSASVSASRIDLLGEVVDRTLHELPHHTRAVICLLKFLLGNVFLI